MPVPPSVLELQQLLHRRRHQSGASLSMEMYERWGPRDKASQRKNAEEAARVAAEARAVEAELVERVRELRADDPDAVVAWARAHQDLLRRFLDSTEDQTARYVANEELEHWQQVVDGTRDWVRGNTFYVRYDRERYAALFPGVG